MAKEIAYPNPPSDRGDFSAQAKYLAALVRTLFGVDLSERTVDDLRQFLWRVGPNNTEDLVASILLECWQQHKSGVNVSDSSIRRIADRYRQRIVRGAKRSIQATTPEAAPAPDFAPEDEVSLVLHEFGRLLEKQSVQDALLFQRYFLDQKKDVRSLAAEIGMSVATVYRKLKAIRNDYLALRNLKTPPSTE